MKGSEGQSLRLHLAVLLLFLVILLPQLAGVSFSQLLYDTPRAPVLAVLLLLGLYALKTLALVLPGTILNLSAGVLFSPVTALCVALSGNLLGLSLGYGMGCVLGRDSVAALLKKSRRTARFLAQWKRGGVKSCLIARLLPLPVEPCSLFFGAVGLPFRRYLGASMLGLLPRMFLGVLAGAAMNHPLSCVFFFPALLCLCVAGALLAWLWRQIQRKERNLRLLPERSGGEG